MLSRIIVYLFPVFLCCFNLSRAQSLEELRTEITRREKAISTLKQELEQAPQSAQHISQEELSALRLNVDQVKIAADGAKIAIQELEAHLLNTQKQCEALNAELQKQANPLTNSAGNGESDTAAQFAACQENVLNIGTTLTLQKNLQQLILRQQGLQESLYQRHNELWLQSRRANENTPYAAATALSQQLQRLKAERDRLSAALPFTGDNRMRRFNQQIEMALITRQILIAELQFEFHNIDNRLQELQFADLSSVSLERIHQVKTELQASEQRLGAMQQQLANNMTVMEQQYGLYQRQQQQIPQSVATRHQQLQEQYQAFAEALTNAQAAQQLIMQGVDSQYTELSKNYITSRYDFVAAFAHPATFGEKLGKALTTFLGQYAVSFQALWHSLQALSTGKKTRLGIICLAIIGLTAWLTSLANHLVRNYRNVKKISFSTRLILFAFGMSKYNLPYIGLLVMTWAVLRVAKVPAPGSQLILLLSIWFLLITIPYFCVHTLSESHLLTSNTERYRVRRVTTAAAIGSLLLALVFMAQWILSEKLIIDSFRWFFCIFTLLISLPLWRILQNMLHFLAEEHGALYTYRIVRLIVQVIPLGFFLFGCVGAFGYLNLAWLMARYLLIALFYTIVWVSFLGLCKDISLAAKKYVLSHTNNSVFWAQDVINPIHSIFRYGSFLLLLYLLAETYNWNANIPVFRDLFVILRKPLFSGDDDSQFTLMNLILLAVILYVIIQFGRWMKSLCYRWVYARVHDTGMRNSLAVFTQYALVTLGFFLALRIIGLDLTAFTVFAGALGVGIGFGLQTIANNFISGILLLIERPLRGGDIITAGNYTGTVERIGMRTLTLTTFDNESVILPNSDFVTSAFINWSHTDQIVRIVCHFDLSYRHDPHDVEQALMNTLMEMAKKGELIHQQDLECGVYAWDYSERGVTYRVLFYLHIDDHGYLRTRHKVMRALWRTCEQRGFEFAYPKADIAMRELGQDFSPNYAADQMISITDNRSPKL